MGSRLPYKVTPPQFSENWFVGMRVLTLLRNPPLGYGEFEIPPVNNFCNQKLKSWTNSWPDSNGSWSQEVLLHRKSDSKTSRKWYLKGIHSSSPIPAIAGSSKRMTRTNLVSSSKDLSAKLSRTAWDGLRRPSRMQVNTASSDCCQPVRAGQSLTLPCS